MANICKYDAMRCFSNSDPRFGGIIGSTADFIEKLQLLDEENWTRFVEQFRVRTDSENRGWRGEYWGKMMRGAAFTYSLTKSPELYRVMTETVRDMLSAEDELGRISSYTVDAELRGWDIWCRKYVLLGMQYYAELCTDEALKAEIIASMCRQADYLISKLGAKEEGKLPITQASSTWRGLNSSSILEPIVRLYSLTGESRYLDFAGHIVAEGGTCICNIFELAYEDKTDPYQYPVVKAYEMISCFEGLLEYYRVTGIEKYREAVLRFANRLINTDITVIGSAGCTHELFDHSSLRQTDTAYTGIMQETCVTVTLMKFFWQLTKLTGDPRFVDLFERSFYNAYLGAVNTEQAVDRKFITDLRPDVTPVPLPFDSYSSLLMNRRGRGLGGLQFMSDGHYYGCCACIGAAGIGLVSKLAVMEKSGAVAVNLYVKGSIGLSTPAGKGLSIATETDYPVDGKVKMTLSLDESEAFSLLLRIPKWSRKTALRVNGEVFEVTQGYTELRRLWQNGDVIELSLEMVARVLDAPVDPRDVLVTKHVWKYDISLPIVVEASPDAGDHIAIERGPLVLARDARLKEDVDAPVCILFDENGIVELAPSGKADFYCQAEYSVPQRDGTSFTVIDYASAGKTFDESSRYGCWMPTK